MTVYAETSAVLRRLFAEEGGEALRVELARADKITSSRLTLVETRRVVRRAERERRLTAAQSADLLAVFAQSVSTWAILEITEEVARRAEDAFPDEPVRTLDAIHLASALFLRQSFPDLVVVTVDERVRANAAQLGFQPSGPRGERVLRMRAASLRRPPAQRGRVSGLNASHLRRIELSTEPATLRP